MAWPISSSIWHRHNPLALRTKERCISFPPWVACKTARLTAGTGVAGCYHNVSSISAPQGCTETVRVRRFPKRDRYDPKRAAPAAVSRRRPCCVTGGCATALRYPFYAFRASMPTIAFRWIACVKVRPRYSRRTIRTPIIFTPTTWRASLRRQYFARAPAEQPLRPCLFPSCHVGNQSLIQNHVHLCLQPFL